MDISVFIPLHMKRWLEYMVGKDKHQNLNLTFKGDVWKTSATFEELRWFQGLSIEGAHIYYTVHE